MPDLPPDCLVDYTEARYAPVINIVVERPDGRILLVKRSHQVGFYPGYWNGIGGFLDDRLDLEDKAVAELAEELTLPPESVKEVERGEIFHAEEPAYGKTWIIHPLKVTVKDSDIALDWEADEYAWVEPKRVREYQVVPSFLRVLEKLGFV